MSDGKEVMWQAMHSFGVQRGGELEPSCGFLAWHMGEPVAVGLHVAEVRSGVREAFMDPDEVTIGVADRATFAWASSYLKDDRGSVENPVEKRSVVIDEELSCMRFEDSALGISVELWRHDQAIAGITTVESEDGSVWVRLCAPSNYCNAMGDKAFEDRIGAVSRRFVEDSWECVVEEVCVVPGCVELRVRYGQNEPELYDDWELCTYLSAKWLGMLDVEFPVEERCGPVREQFEAARVLIGGGVHTREEVEVLQAAAVRNGDVKGAELLDRAIGFGAAAPHAVCLGSGKGDGSLLLIGVGETPTGALAHAVKTIGAGGDGFFPIHVRGEVREQLEASGLSTPVVGVGDLRRYLRRCTPEFMRTVNGSELPMVAGRELVNGRGHVGAPGQWKSGPGREPLVR